MAVAFVTERGETASTSNASTYTVATFTPTAGNVIVAVILGTDNAASFNVSTINGTGLTWTNTGIHVLRDNGTIFADGELWWATTTGAATGTITVTWSEAITSCVIWMGEFSGVNTTAAIKATAKDEAGTTDPNVSLAVAPDSDSLCVASYMAINVDPNQTAEAGWTSQLAVDTLLNPTTGFGVWVSTAADQTFTATGTDCNHFAFIAEIDATASGDANVTTTTVASTTAVPTPVVTANADTVPGSVASVAAIDTPVVTADANVTTALVAAITDIPTPVVTATSPDANVALTDVAAVTAVPTPAVTADANTTLSDIAAVAAIPTPAVTADADLAPATVAAVVDIPAPTVTTTGDANVTLTDVAAIATIPTPVVSADADLVAALVAAVADIPVPVVTATSEAAPESGNPSLVAAHVQANATKYGLVNRGERVWFRP